MAEIKQTPPRSVAEAVYRNLIEPVLGQLPSSQLPPAGQMPGQNTPLEPNPGVGDILKLAAAPALVDNPMALLSSVLGSQIMGGQLGKTGQQLGQLVSPEWGERGQQMGQALGQLMIPGEKAPGPGSIPSMALQVKRPQVQLPPMEELIAEYSKGGKPEFPKGRPDLPGIKSDKPVRKTQPIETRVNKTPMEYRGPEVQKRQAIGGRGGYINTNPLPALTKKRPPSIMGVDFNPTIQIDPKAWSHLRGMKSEFVKGVEVPSVLKVALEEMHRAYPQVMGKLVKRIEIKPSMELPRGADAAYSPSARTIYFPARRFLELSQKDFPTLMGTLAHEIQHQAQFEGVGPRGKLIGLRSGPELSKKIEPPAYQRQYSTKTKVEKSLLGKNPDRLSQAEQDMIDYDAQRHWRMVKSAYGVRD